MSITTTQTTQTTHRATLAGGITVSLEPAVFGATLTLSDTLRALALSLTPEQVAEMGKWGMPHFYGDPNATPDGFADDVFDFRRVTLCRLGESIPTIYETWPVDVATLRALARAMYCPACDGTGTLETYPAHDVEAYTGAGDPRIDYLSCDQCGGTGLARAYQEQP